jgi:hypothetical protein
MTTTRLITVVSAGMYFRSRLMSTGTTALPTTVAVRIQRSLRLALLACLSYQARIGFSRSVT